jgi:hypothetical protein
VRSLLAKPSPNNALSFKRFGAWRDRKAGTSQMKNLWICSSNAVAALCLVVLADQTMGNRLYGLWPLLEVVVAAALTIGIILEIRNSRWAPRWNVGLFLGIVAGTFLNATAVPAILHSSDYSEGSAVAFAMFGIPALFLAAIDMVVYRRARKVGAS